MRKRRDEVAIEHETADVIRSSLTFIGCVIERRTT